jgi:MFS family permease
MPMGALVMNPLAAYLIRKKGMKHTVMIGFTVAIIAFGSIFFQNNIFFLMPVLFMVGSGIAISNVSINTCVGALEESENVKIMSTCHGLFSLGLMFGSLVASYSSGLGVHPKFHLLGVCLVLVLLMILAQPHIYNIFDKHKDLSPEKAAFKLPSGTFLWMIIISLCINITEGTMADWAAVYMRDVVKSSPYFIGLGLTSYSLFMGLGRLLGDYLIPTYGANNILKAGSLLCIIGLLIAILVPLAFYTIIGFALIGAGVSCGAPILYASAARAPGMPPGSGLAVMNTFAMGGFLFGPVIIGFIAEASSLPISFAFIASLGIIWFLYARKIKLF